MKKQRQKPRGNLRLRPGQPHNRRHRSRLLGQNPRGANAEILRHAAEVDPESRTDQKTPGRNSGNDSSQPRLCPIRIIAAAAFETAKGRKEGRSPKTAW